MLCQFQAPPYNDTRSAGINTRQTPVTKPRLGAPLPTIGMILATKRISGGIHSLVCTFNSTPKVVRLVVRMYVKHLLLLRNVYICWPRHV
jgi:hypothetical protein